MAPSTARITNNGYNMGQGGYAGYARIQLPGMTQEEESSPSEPIAVNFRKGIVYYFGNLQMQSNMLGMAKDVNNGRKAATALVSSVQDAQKQDWGKNAEPVKTVQSAVEGALRSIRASAPSWLSEAANSAIGAIRNMLPKLISDMLSELGQLGIPVLSNIKNFAKSFAAGVRKTLQLWNSRGVYEVLRKGAPTEIVRTLRIELGQDAAASFASSVYEIAKGVAVVVSAGASVAITGVIDAIKGCISFIWDIYKKVRDYFALKTFFGECKVRFDGNHRMLYDQQLFCEWLAQWMDELPIIASHAMVSNITGSYFGYLTSVKDDGSDISQRVIERGYNHFVALKKPAKEYIRSYPHSFVSDDKMVALSLTITEKGGIDKTDGQAAKKVGFFQRGLMKLGIKKKTVY